MDNIDYDQEIERRYHPENFEDSEAYESAKDCEESEDNENE